MADIQTRTSEPGTMDMREGDDFVCSNCGCEVRVRHSGDPARQQHVQAFVCCCGTRMDKEQRSA